MLSEFLVVVGKRFFPLEALLELLVALFALFVEVHVFATVFVRDLFGAVAIVLEFDDGFFEFEVACVEGFKRLVVFALMSFGPSPVAIGSSDVDSRLRGWEGQYLGPVVHRVGFDDITVAECGWT